MRLLRTVALFLAGALLLYASEALAARKSVSWAPVAGSVGYLLQIRDAQDSLVVDRELSSHETSLELAPGEYRLRVASLNKFGEPAAWAGWQELVIPGETGPDPERPRRFGCRRTLADRSQYRACFRYRRNNHGHCPYPQWPSCD